MSSSLLWVLACGGASSGPGHEPVATPPLEPASPAARGPRSDADVEALSAALARGAKLLDVRTPEEFAGGHVPGAVNVPLGTFRASPDDPALAGIDPAVPTFLICAAGGRSAKAADELSAGGFSAVNVTGGTNAWIAAGKPVEP